NSKQSTAHLYQQLGIPQHYQTVWLRLAVSDTGIGIPADKQEAIFESFTQADGSATRRYGGSGLGLAINRQLVTLMGGAIGVQSEEGKGSTFWATLPLFLPNVEQSSRMVNGEMPQLQGVADASLPSSPARMAKRVLLVEDNEVNRKVAVRLLERLGYEVDIASDGVEAVHKTAQQHYHAVLMDVHMPRMDGLEATRLIRKREGSTGEHQVIIAMTASAMKEDVQQCLASGMDDYLSKPVKMEVLREMLERWQDSDSTGFPEELPPIDRDFLAEITGGDIDFERELLQEFVNTVPGLIERTHEAIASGNNEALVSAAHTIKGSARAVGAHTFAEIAFALERAGKEQRMGDASDIAQSLSVEWQRVQDYIEQELFPQAA
ncbi:MAG: response regulator, partial [bacterium]|nr:response regulator [bacterium]